MSKELKLLLQECKIHSQWYNINAWQKDKFTNLLELVEIENIKITKQKLDDIKNLLTIKYDYGQMKVVRFSSFSDIERDLINLFAQKRLYLGDRFKIIHRLKNYSN